jgi:hypothetical protein
LLKFTVLEPHQWLDLIERFHVDAGLAGGGWPGAAFSLNQGSVARWTVVLRPCTERCMRDGEASPCRAIRLVPVRRYMSPASAGRVPLNAENGPAGLRKNVRMTISLYKQF